jgi:hypothetical protein
LKDSRLTALDQFNDHSTLYLETLCRNSKDRQRPAWFVREWERLYVRMLTNSGKVKHPLNNPLLLIALCGMEGQQFGPRIPAVGGEVCDDPKVEVTVDRLLDDRYNDTKRQITRQALKAGRESTILELRIDE